MVLRRCTVIISVAAPFIRLLIVSRSAGVCLPLQRARRQGPDPAALAQRHVHTLQREASDTLTFLARSLARA